MKDLAQEYRIEQYIIVAMLLAKVNIDRHHVAPGLSARVNVDYCLMSYSLFSI